MSTHETIELIDAYLLGEERDRDAVFTRVGAWRPDNEAATPIVRAIKLVGAKAADESLIALRLILAGKPVADEHVAELRKIVRSAVKGEQGAKERYHAVLTQVA